MRVALALLLLCGTAHAEDQRCPRGARTTLTIQRAERPEILRADEAIGGDVLSLRAGKRELMHAVSHDFHWMCLGYSKKRGHLVGSQALLGQGLVLRTIGYLAEDADVIEASAFTRERFHAYSALASRDGRFVAFIGGRDEVALYVLDVARDRIRKLGPAPEPPDTSACRAWSCVGSYVDFERWRFANGALLVRSGAARRGKRTLQRFRL